VLTDDGFEVVSVPTHTQDGKLSSMASSVQALSEAVARELVLGPAPYVIIASEAGHLIQLRVPGHELVLAALFDADETLGKALSVSRRAAEKLAASLTSR
jgi:predicted regulator of Ras-like GTPase activity (Roadblock/LC7/MglB family)